MFDQLQVGGRRILTIQYRVIDPDLEITKPWAMDPCHMGGSILRKDRLFVTVISTSDCHPRGPGFDSRLYPRNVSGSIGSGTGFTQPREDNWVAT